MGIPPKQIGWSNESNLLWKILSQLGKLKEVTSKIQTGTIAILSGFVSGPNAPIVSTDTILEAFEKTQAQIDANGSVIQSLGSISGTVNIDLSLGTLITATLTGATTLTFSGLPPSTRETAFTLRFAGIHAITLPAGTKYPAGEVPVPEGALYEIPCTINNAGELIVYGVINDIKTP